MTYQLNKWVMAAAIAVTSAAQANTVVARVGDSIMLTDGARGEASTFRAVSVSLDSAASTLFLSNGTTDPSLPSQKPPFGVRSGGH